MKKLLFLSLFALASVVLSTRAQAQAIVIANPSVKAADVSKSDLKEVFTGASTSLGGGHVIPVLLKEGSVNDEFLTTYISKTDSAFRASWRNLVFSGQATMPKSLDSDAAVVEYVVHNPGAIGYIGKTSPHDGVKVLAVK